MYLHIAIRIQGIERRGDGKNCATLPSKERGEVGEPRNLFPRLGVWVIVCSGDAWNLPSEGSGVGDLRLVSPAEGAGALALAFF